MALRALSAATPPLRRRYGPPGTSERKITLSPASRYLQSLGRLGAEDVRSQLVATPDPTGFHPVGNHARHAHRTRTPGRVMRPGFGGGSRVWVLGQTLGLARLRLLQIGSEPGRGGVTGQGLRERLAAHSAGIGRRGRSDGRRDDSPRSGGFRGSGPHTPGTHRPCRLVWQPSAGWETARRDGNASSLVCKQPSRNVAGPTGRTTWCTRRSRPLDLS